MYTSESCKNPQNVKREITIGPIPMYTSESCKNPQNVKQNNILIENQNIKEHPQQT